MIQSTQLQTFLQETTNSPVLALHQFFTNLNKPFHFYIGNTFGESHQSQQMIYIYINVEYLPKLKEHIVETYYEYESTVGHICYCPSVTFIFMETVSLDVLERKPEYIKLTDSQIMYHKLININGNDPCFSSKRLCILKKFYSSHIFDSFVKVNYRGLPNLVIASVYPHVLLKNSKNDHLIKAACKVNLNNGELLYVLLLLEKYKWFELLFVNLGTEVSFLYEFSILTENSYLEKTLAPHVAFSHKFEGLLHLIFKSDEKICQSLNMISEPNLLKVAFSRLEIFLSVLYKSIFFENNKVAYYQLEKKIIFLRKLLEQFGVKVPTVSEIYNKLGIVTDNVEVITSLFCNSKSFRYAEYNIKLEDVLVTATRGDLFYSVINIIIRHDLDVKLINAIDKHGIPVLNSILCKHHFKDIYDCTAYYESTRCQNILLGLGCGYLNIETYIFQDFINISRMLSNNSRRVIEYIETYSDFIDTKDSKGNSLLILSLKYNFKALVTVILKQHAHLIIANNYRGTNCLMKAIKYDNLSSGLLISYMMENRLIESRWLHKNVHENSCEHYVSIFSSKRGFDLLKIYGGAYSLNVYGSTSFDIICEKLMKREIETIALTYLIFVYLKYHML